MVGAFDQNDKNICVLWIGGQTWQARKTGLKQREHMGAYFIKK